jgi:hypothetical protein
MVSLFICSFDYACLAQIFNAWWTFFSKTFYWSWTELSTRWFHLFSSYVLFLVVKPHITVVHYSSAALTHEKNNCNYNFSNKVITATVFSEDARFTTSVSSLPCFNSLLPHRVSYGKICNSFKLVYSKMYLKIAKIQNVTRAATL